MRQGGEELRTVPQHSCLAARRRFMGRTDPLGVLGRFPFCTDFKAKAFTKLSNKLG